MQCNKCGATNADDATFCTVCGNNLKASVPPPSSGGPSTTPPPEFSFGAIPAGHATFRISTAFSNAINLVKSPANFMRQNKDTVVPVNSIIINYVAVLAVIPFIATLIGNLWFYSYLSVFGFLGAGFYGYVFALAVVNYILDIV